MNLSGLSLCTRARVLLPRLVAGRASNAALARHVGTCPRCRPALRAARAGLGVPADRADDATAYVLAVVQAAGRARLAGMLEELSRACAARWPHPSGGVPHARPIEEVRQDVQHLLRRLGPYLAARDRTCPPVPAPGRALLAARACLAAAERIDGPTIERQLHLAACALAADDATSAGALCSGLVAEAGRADERARLARRATQVARAWGLPPAALGALVRQPAAAGCN